MVQLISGTRTQGDEGEPRTPPSTPSENIPRDIEIASTPQETVQQPVVQTPETYIAGTYARSFRRTPGRSPSVPPGFRPAKFAFLPQPDFRTAQEPSEAEEMAGQEQTEENHPAAANNAVQQQVKPRTLRPIIFEAPMRPLDVARDMYLDYTTTQSIKFYNKGCEKLPGEPSRR